MASDNDDFEAQRKEADQKIKDIRKIDHTFDMAYKLGSLQAKAKWAVKMMRLGSENCKNEYVRGLLRKEAADLRKFLVEECQVEMPFDPRFDI